MPQTLEEYKDYVGDRLQSVTEILPVIAMGDFSRRLDIPFDEDEFTELYAGINYMLEDIEENLRKRKEAEEQLRESEQKYRDIVELSPDGIVTIDMEGSITSCNKSFVDITGFSKDEIVGKHFSKIPTLRAKDVPTWLRMFASIIKGKTPPPLELEWVHKDGVLNWGEVRISLMKRGKEITGVQVIIRDITESKKVKDALVRSEEKYRSLVENVSDAIISTDMEFNITSWNRAAEAIYGWRAWEVNGKYVNDVTGLEYPDDNQDEVVNEFIEKGYWKGEVIQRRRDGPHLNILSSVSMIRDDQGNPVGAVAINRDITERKRMEEELLQTEKLASIGQLAAGMAHEVNTPLTNISLITENMMKMTNDPELTKKMKSLSEQRRIASNIVTSLLSFSRKIEPKMSALKLDTVLSESISSLEKTKPENIEIELDIPKKLQRIKADPGQLRQAFTNIIDNAFDAMPKGGKLTVKAVKKDKENIEIRFIDNGIGITKEDLEHVFEPFFTKKEVGRGVGLGLSICHGIIEAHKGTIRVESQEGKGTTFTITLPEG